MLHALLIRLICMLTNALTRAPLCDLITLILLGLLFSLSHIFIFSLLCTRATVLTPRASAALVHPPVATRVALGCAPANFQNIRRRDFMQDSTMNVGSIFTGAFSLCIITIDGDVMCKPSHEDAVVFGTGYELSLMFQRRVRTIAGMNTTYRLLQFLNVCQEVLRFTEVTLTPKAELLPLVQGIYAMPAAQ